MNDLLSQFRKNKQNFDTKKDYMEIILPTEQDCNKWMKEQKEKERNEETRELLRDNEFINAREIIKETSESEPWTNYDTFNEYIAQNKNQSKEQILEARKYFAKELIRIIVKNWKYDYPREQFEETEENIIDLIAKKQNNFELADLKTRIRLAKNGCLQYYLSI